MSTQLHFKCDVLYQLSLAKVFEHMLQNLRLLIFHSLLLKCGHYRCLQFHGEATKFTLQVLRVEVNGLFDVSGLLEQTGLKDHSFQKYIITRIH